MLRHNFFFHCSLNSAISDQIYLTGFSSALKDIFVPLSFYSLCFVLIYIFVFIGEYSNIGEISIFTLISWLRFKIVFLRKCINIYQTCYESSTMMSGFLQDRDADRTIGIDTDYIETQDYDLEPEDKEFLIEVGRVVV